MFHIGCFSHEPAALRWTSISASSWPGAVCSRGITPVPAASSAAKTRGIPADILWYPLICQSLSPPHGRTVPCSRTIPPRLTSLRWGASRGLGGPIAAFGCAVWHGWWACRRDERPQLPVPGGLLTEVARKIAFGVLIRPARLPKYSGQPKRLSRLAQIVASHTGSSPMCSTVQLQSYQPPAQTSRPPLTDPISTGKLRAIRQ